MNKSPDEYITFACQICAFMQLQTHQDIHADGKEQGQDIEGYMSFYILVGVLVGDFHPKYTSFKRAQKVVKT